MQLYIKLWRARHEWFALSPQDRSNFLSHAGASFAAASSEAELIGFAIDEADGGHSGEYRYLAVWRIHSGSAAGRLETALEKLGWKSYFEGVDALAPSISPDALLRDMAIARRPLAVPQEQTGGIGGFFSKIAAGLGLRSAPEEPKPARPAVPPPPPIPAERPAAPAPVVTMPTPAIAAAAPVSVTIPAPTPVATVATPPVVATSSVAPPVLVIDEPEPFELPTEPEAEPEIVFESARIEMKGIRPAETHALAEGRIDVDAYLERIGYSGSREPTIETLRALHQAHLRSVPFENLDIISGHSIVLDERRFFEKIVVARRGGFCYELNGLFAALLRELGFNVTLLSGNVTNREDATHGPDFDHMLLMVKLEERWLVDVGFGDSFSEPLRIDETGEQYLPEGTYRIYNDASLRSLLRRGDDMSWSEQYIFTLLPRELTDFANMCDFHQTSPHSHFTHQRICSRLTADGRISLTDTHLILSSGGKRRVLQLSNPLEHKTMLREYFGIFTSD